MRTLVVILIIMAMAAGAGAQAADKPQPYDVNGVKLGTAFSEWKQGPGARCVPWVAVEPDVTSYSCPDTTYAGAPVQEVVGFYGGRLISFYLVAPHDRFNLLRAAMKQKFGQPWRTEPKAYAVENGTTVNGEHNRWSNGLTSLNLAEFGPDRNHTVLYFSHIEIAAEKTRNAKTKAGDK